MTTQSGGVCLWFTGRSGSGKSTVTGALLPLLEEDGRTVTVLDVVPELRKLRCEPTSSGKLIRKAFVAREVVRHGGVVICVTISSSGEIRERAREMVGPDSFLEIHVDAPVALAERRRNTRPTRPSFIKRLRRIGKRLRRKLRGRADSHVAPAEPALRIDTETTPADVAANQIFELLQKRGFVGSQTG